MAGSNMRQLRLLLADKNIDMENAIVMNRLLDELASCCYLHNDRYNECHPINQQILYNHGTAAGTINL